jgi:glycosyltransferase involved in cell wall biosynthesis
MAPLVSIIVCFLNEEVFLSEAVDSVLQQAYTHWELLLVDDGSTDNSSMLAKRFAARNPDKITYLEHENHANRGLSASRNTGIRNARGELLAFLDADDVWLPTKLTQQVAIMQRHPEVTLLCEASEYWFDWAGGEKNNVFQPLGITPGRSYEPPQLLLDLYPLGPGAAPCPSGLMINTKRLGNRYFEESFRGIYAIYEDQAFLSKIYLHDTVYVSDACTNRYRQRVGSIVQTVRESGHYHQSRQYYLAWLEQYLQTHQITDRRLWNSLWKAQKAYRTTWLKKALRKLWVFGKQMF